MNRSGIRSDASTYDIMMECLENNGDIDGVISIFEQMRKEGIRANISSYSRIIKQYLRQGEQDTALMV